MERHGQQRARPTEWWPPPDQEPIGEERARELVRYLRERAPAVLAVAQAELASRHGDTPIETSAVPASQLAKMFVVRTMTCITVGMVYVGQAGSADTIPIQLDRAGNVRARLSRSEGPLQRWIAG